MIFGKKRNWEDQYDEDYAARADRHERNKGSTLWIHLIGFGLIVGVLLGLLGLTCGQVAFEKTLTTLAAPVGLVWLLLIFGAYFSLHFKQGWPALLMIGCWLILTIFGNSFVSNHLLLNLEAPFLKNTIDDIEKVDVAFLLGGGTKTNPQGQAQGNFSADRILTAAKLYHAGKVELIVCTGKQSFRTLEEDMDPNEEAAQLLMGLNIPESAIARIQGHDTSEEMEIAATFLEQQNLTDAKVGIITSAWHLQRANRLAMDNGLTPELIPSDFKSGPFVISPNIFVPSANSLKSSAICVKEHLARLMGR